jgi:8-oxo-dGTP diphosphatase
VSEPFGDAPVFGRPVDGCRIVVRPSAYAIVRRGVEIALVRAPGGVFLPGGGVDHGELPEQAVEREAREECGLVVRVVATIGRAIEFVHSPSESACFEKRSAFFVADVAGLATKTELDHVLVWATADDALAALSHESQRWAVRRHLGRA